MDDRTLRFTTPKGLVVSIEVDDTIIEEDGRNCYLSFTVGMEGCEIATFAGYTNLGVEVDVESNHPDKLFALFQDFVLEFSHGKQMITFHSGCGDPRQDDFFLRFDGTQETFETIVSFLSRARSRTFSGTLVR